MKQVSRRIFFMSGLGAAACGFGARRLNVYNWSDYVAPDTIENFEREFNVRVRYGTYESDEEMVARVMSGNSGWDLVFPSADFLLPMQKMDLLQPLRHELLPNIDALAPEFQRPPWDPQLQWCIPYMWGTTGIAYQRTLDPAPQSWADLWHPRIGGRLAMLDDPNDLFGACLKKLRLSINTSEPAELQAAKREAVDQKRLLRAYLNAEARDQLVSGDLLVAQTWAVTAAQAIAGAPSKLAFSFPSEGFPRYCDNVAILRESRRVELAHRFIDYLLRPEVAASIVRATQTSTVNAKAKALLPTELRDNSVLYPPAEILSRGEWIEPHSTASQRLRDRLWTEIKSA